MKPNADETVLVRVHPSFAAALVQLKTEGEAAESRRVSMRELTAVLSQLLPADWPDFLALRRSPASAPLSPPLRERHVRKSSSRRRHA